MRVVVKREDRATTILSPRFVVDSLSQAPQSSHGVTDRDVEVGGRFASGRRAPSSTLRVGLAHSNNVSAVSSILPGGHGMGADRWGLGDGGCGL
jgi:hypothetical protein